MYSLIRSVISPLFSLLFLMMGSGLFNTFVSLRLQMEGVFPETIGVVTSALYLGILIGSMQMDRWVIKQGHVRSFILLALAVTALVLLQAAWIDPWYWAFLRLLMGICTAGVFVIIESWLLIQTPMEKRGAILSVYLGVLYAALSFGQLLLNITNPEGFFPFYVTAFLALCSIFPILGSKTSSPNLEKNGEKLSLVKLYRLSPVGFLGGVVSGMVLAVTYGLIPVFAKESGMNVGEIGLFMAVLIFGGFSLQWPVGRLADKMSRRRILNAISFLTAFLCLALSIAEPLWLLLLLAWFYGGFAFTIYPVAMAHACEKVQDKEIVSATCGFVLSYSLGAVGGPLLAPFAMEFFGPSGLFYFLALIAALLGLIGMQRSSRVKSLPLEVIREHGDRPDDSSANDHPPYIEDPNAKGDKSDD